MDNKISPIQNKTFDDFLKEFKTHNKLILLNSALESKNISEIAKEDGDKREEQLDLANESLKEISERLKNLLKGVDKNNEKLLAKIEKLKAPEIKPLKEIQDKEPLSLKEKLKSQVASIKSFGSRVKETASGLVEAVKSPTQLFEKAKASATSAGKGLLGDIREIAGTKKEYSVEGERFAKLYSQTAKGTQFQKGGKGSLEVGMESFNELKEKEKEISALEEKIKKFESYGFDAPKKDTQQLEKLKKEFSDIDVRSKEKAPEVIAKLKEEVEKAPEVIAKEKKVKEINPESDNIVTSDEKTSDLTEQILDNSNKSFKIFEDQLKELKLIKEYLTPKEDDQVSKDQAKVEPKPEESKSESKIPDIDVDLKRGPKKSLGGKLLRGLRGGVGGGAAAGIAGGAAAVGLIGGMAYLGFQKESQIAETKEEAEVKKAGLDESLAGSAATIEEAAGSGLSKEDEMFKKEPFWKRLFKPKDTSAQVTPVSSTTGTQMAQATSENQMLKEEAAKPAPPTIINNTNTVSSSQQTVAPIRTSPRPMSNSFERKMSEVAVY